VSSSVEPCPVGQVEGSEYITVSEAAARLGISRERLIGYCMDRRPWMPISDGALVRADSLEGLRKYLAAVHSSAAP
jgi:hypothetical protein